MHILERMKHYNLMNFLIQSPNLWPNSHQLAMRWRKLVKLRRKRNETKKQSLPGLLRCKQKYRSNFNLASVLWFCSNLPEQRLLRRHQRVVSSVLLSNQADGRRQQHEILGRRCLPFIKELWMLSRLIVMVFRAPPVPYCASMCYFSWNPQIPLESWLNIDETR